MECPCQALFIAAAAVVNGGKPGEGVPVPGEDLFVQALPIFLGPCAFVMGVGELVLRVVDLRAFGAVPDEALEAINSGIVFLQLDL